MLHAHERCHADSSNGAATSSFGRWLERMQRKNCRGSFSYNNVSNSVGDGSSEYRSYMPDLYFDPRRTVLSPSPQPPRHSPSHRTASSFSGFYSQPGQSRMEELEGLLFTQNHLRSHFAPSNGVGSAAHTDSHDNTEAYDGARSLHPSQLMVRQQQQQQQQIPPAYCSLQLPASEADLSSVGDAADVGAGIGVNTTTFNELFASAREPFRSNFLLAGGSEAERYIARLEEEVQSLVAESCEKNRLMVAALTARDAMALQLEEARQRAVVERNEQTAEQTITYSFLRTLSFHRILEERSRVMELNTQISVLKHELKLAETMRAQAQVTATSAAASTAAAQELQRKLEEQQIAQLVSTTVRSLLQQEYARLAELMSEMPSKMQSMLNEKQAKELPAGSTTRASPAASPSPPWSSGPAEAAESAEQRRLCALLESALTAMSAQQEKDGNKKTAKGAVAKNNEGFSAVADHPAEALSLSDSTCLLALVGRAHLYQEAVLELYCNGVDAKAGLAQYEMNIVRLIYEKQSALTWAALYEEKKDEVRHLNEKLMEMRGELRAATSTATTFASPRGVSNGAAGSFAGSTNSQGYEAYTAPYVPLKKTNKQMCTSSTRNVNNRNMSTVNGTSRSARLAVPKKSIVELREEARRLGAHPAIHYPQPVTSPSPSMPSLYVSRTPLEVEQTVQKLRSPDRQASSLPSTPERHAAPTMKSPAVALIRFFAPRSGSQHSSSSFSASPSLNSSSSAAPKQSALSPMLSETPEAQVAQVVVEKKLENQTARRREVSPRKEKREQQNASKEKGRAPERAPSRSSSYSSSSSPSSVSTRLDDRPAIPVPASRKLEVQMPALQRVTTAASSSLSSVASVSGTKPSVGNVTSSYPLSGPAVSAKSEAPAAVKPHTVHNSFDDDDDSSSEKNNKPAVKATVSAVAATTQSQLPSKTSTVEATRQTFLSKDETTKASTAAIAEVRRISLDETFRTRSKVRQSGDDGDTSSLSLSTLSSSSMHSRSASPQMDATAATTITATVAKSKSNHPRKSSFDDDDGDDDEDHNDASKTPTSTPPVSSLKGTPPISKSVVPSLSLAGARPKSEPATVSAAAASKQPQKLKLPTW